MTVDQPPTGESPSSTHEFLTRRRAISAMAATLGGAAAWTTLKADPAEATGYADLLLSNLSNYATARNNLTVGLVHTPEQYGAVGDGTTDDSAAIQAGINALATAGGGSLLFTARTYLINATVVVKSGVTLCTGTMHRSLLVNTGTTTLKAGSGLTGWMFDTVGTSATVGMAIVGFDIVGPGDHAAVQVGAIRLQSALNARLQWLSINKFSDSCIKVDHTSTSLAVEDCCIQTDSTGRTLTAVCGSLDLDGTDHYIRSIQCNGGPADSSGTAGNTKVTYPGNFYRTGAYIRCITSWFFDLNGEFGDVGIYLDSTASNNRFIGTRADVNAGHGFYLNGAANNQFVGCYAIGDALATTGGLDNYDGVIHVNGAKQNKWTNYLCFPLGSISMRYGWNDATTGNTQPNLNTVDFPLGPSGWLTRDLVNIADPVLYSMQPAGTGTIYQRPPSRYLAGNTWYDTTNNKLTFSDGSKWRDSTGAVVGNLMDPNQAIGRASVEWANVDGKSTVAGMYTVNGSATVQAQFAALPKLAVAAATASAGGAFQIQGLGRFPVTAGTTYVLGVRTLANTIGASVSIGVNWFNSGGTYLSTTYAGGGATNNTSTLTPAVGTGLLAPTGATSAQILVIFSRTGMASGEAHYISYAFAQTASVTDYLEP